MASHDSSDTDSASASSDENIDYFFSGSSGEDEVENPDKHFIFDLLASDDEEANAMPKAINEPVTSTAKWRCLKFSKIVS